MAGLDDIESRARLAFAKHALRPSNSGAAPHAAQENSVRSPSAQKRSGVLASVCPVVNVVSGTTTIVLEAAGLEKCYSGRSSLFGYCAADDCGGVPLSGRFSINLEPP